MSHIQALKPDATANNSRKGLFLWILRVAFVDPEGGLC